jgi:hypothetical protein
MLKLTIIAETVKIIFKIIKVPLKILAKPFNFKRIIMPLTTIEEIVRKF